MLKHPYWIVHGKVYDFSPFIPKHPGGTRWFSRSNGRDISAAVLGYHPDPSKLAPILDKYEVKGMCAADALDPALNVPSFVLPKLFDGRKDLPEISSDSMTGDEFLSDVKKEMRTPNMRRLIQRADIAFDIVALALFLLHLFLCFPAVSASSTKGWLPASLLCLGFVITRTSLAGVGHYHCHRAKNGFTDWGDALFDIQYVGATSVIYDGHVLMHHMYTQSNADVKRTVFTAMLQLPRLWRVPVTSLVRFGHLLSGMVTRYVFFRLEPEPEGSEWPLVKHASFLMMRLLMVLELVHAARCGRLALWFAQFFIVIWVNQFMIVASHDFEIPEDGEKAQNENQRPQWRSWGKHQVLVSLDMSITGCRFVDIFLSAGLSSHRVHHLLPYQRSGFANIVSEDVVRRMCLKHGIPWKSTRSFQYERLPLLLQQYLLQPPPGRLSTVGLVRETFDYQSIPYALKLIFLGFTGEGSL